MQIHVTVLFVLAYFLGSILPTAQAQDIVDAIYVPVGTLTLSAPRGVMPERAPVRFPHSLHFDLNCKQCHHNWDAIQPIKGCASQGCHDQIFSKKKATEKPGFKSAYHQNCIGCHKALNRERIKMEKVRFTPSKTLPKSGPTGCIDCHPKP